MFNIWHEISPERIHPEDFIAVYFIIDLNYIKR